MITGVSDRPTRTPNRDLYLDALRTAAIVRVVTYHTFGGSWLSWVFPAMGVMFALAGGLMVRSLDKQPPLTVIRNRARRLLPALWLFGLIIIPVMIWGGGALSEWTDPNTGEPLPLWKLVFWVVPIFDPPGNEFGANFTVVLWYLRTYLWLVALSPLMLKAFRKYPLPTLLAPLAIVVAQSFNVIPGPDEGQFWDLLSTLGMYAPCWMLGFAHRTGKLEKVPMPAILGVVGAAALGGAAWALTHPITDDPASTYDLNGIPLANVLWSTAFIIVLLRFAPDASWIGRTPFLGRLVALVNNRAVTIYLWHNVMIDASFPIDDWLTRWLPAGLVENPAWDFLTVWVLVAACVLAFGWVEDLAARRKPRLFPVGPSAAERRAEYAAQQAAQAEPDPASRPVEQPVPAVAGYPHNSFDAPYYDAPSRDAYGPGDYGRGTQPPNAYAQNAYAQNAYAQGPYPQESYAPNSHAQDPYPRNAYASDNGYRGHAGYDNQPHGYGAQRDPYGPDPRYSGNRRDGYQQPRDDERPYPSERRPQEQRRPAPRQYTEDSTHAYPTQRPAPEEPTRRPHH